MSDSIDKAIENNKLLQGGEVVRNKSWRKDIDQKSNPAAEYEYLRRRIETNTQEFWNFVHAEVVKAQTLDKSENSELIKALQNVLDLGVEHKRYLLRLLCRPFNEL